jgi:hypothetical protein
MDRQDTERVVRPLPKNKTIDGLARKTPRCVDSPETKFARPGGRTVLKDRKSEEPKFARPGGSQSAKARS